MRIKGFNSIVGKIVMTIVFALVIGFIYIAPAFSRDGDDRRGYNDDRRGYNTQGRYRQDRYEHGRYVYDHGRRVYQPRTYYHPEPVYAPPPVVYYPEPEPSPGISLVFPIIIR